MDNKSFWLASISEDSLIVKLVSPDAGGFKIASSGQDVLYQSTPDSFVAAIDQSLSDAASLISLPEELEPNTIALIISPYWVGSDGKIVPDKIKLFESMFKELKLRPMGFISYDDAIVEEANLADGFPASFVVVKIEANTFIVSLTYLGKVIERIIRPISDSFEPSDLESALLEFKTDSTLPPQIILLGDVSEDCLEKVKNYPWIGKKNIETFLHFPEIKRYTDLESATIFTKAITSQFQPPSEIPESKREEEIEVLIPEIEDPPEEPLVLSEVTADELGFTESDNFIIPEEIPEAITPKIKAPKINFKFKLPKISLPTKNYLLYPIVVSPLLILIPFYFSSSVITLNFTPYNFSKSIQVTLDPVAPSVDTVHNIIPVNRQTFDLTNSASVTTTGTKVIGQKSQGEVTIFNKQDRTQNLPKGTILTNSSGLKFETITSAQIASSSSDLSLGVVTLGQTKVMVSAVDIGSEYNLEKDTLLNFKDFPSTVLLAKISNSLSGGTKTNAKAVAQSDKVNAENLLTEKINSAIDEKIAKEVSINQGIIKDAVQIKKSRVETNREVGEEADELTASVTSTVYVFYLDESQKSELIKSFLSQESGFDVSTYEPSNFEVTLTKGKNTIDKLQGDLTITGKSLPSVDSNAIIKLVSGKSQPKAIALIKNNYPRVYNYQINTNFGFLKSVNPLPFRHSNISIVIK